MKRLLFVDDEPKVLEGLRRMLYPLRGEWGMTFVTGARESLKLLSEAQYDVMVTDIRMPEMSGIELLSEVVKSHPRGSPESFCRVPPTRKLLSAP